MGADHCHSLSNPWLFSLLVGQTHLATEKGIGKSKENSNKEQIQSNLFSREEVAAQIGFFIFKFLDVS